MIWLLLTRDKHRIKSLRSSTILSILLRIHPLSSLNKASSLARLRTDVGLIVLKVECSLVFSGGVDVVVAIDTFQRAASFMGLLDRVKVVTFSCLVLIRWAFKQWWRILLIIISMSGLIMNLSSMPLHLPLPSSNVIRTILCKPIVPRNHRLSLRVTQKITISIYFFCLVVPCTWFALRTLKLLLLLVLGLNIICQGISITIVPWLPLVTAIGIVVFVVKAYLLTTWPCDFISIYNIIISSRTSLMFPFGRPEYFDTFVVTVIASFWLRLVIWVIFTIAAFTITSFDMDTCWRLLTTLLRTSMVVTVVLNQVVLTVIKFSSFELALVFLNLSSCNLSWRSLILGLIDLNVAFVLVFSSVLVMAVVHKFPQILKLIVPFGHSDLNVVLIHSRITVLTNLLPCRLAHFPFELALSLGFPLRSRSTYYSVSHTLEVIIVCIRLMLRSLLLKWRFSMLGHYH